MLAALGILASIGSFTVGSVFAVLTFMLLAGGILVGSINMSKGWDSAKP